MATREIVNFGRQVELTKIEAASVIGKLGAQLADEYLPVNYYSYSESAAFVRVFDASGNVETRMFLIVDSKPRYIAGDIVEKDETIIILSRGDAAKIMVSLTKQLSSRSCSDYISVTVKDGVGEYYRLELIVSC
jgi:hypothetical protein